MSDVERISCTNYSAGATYKMKIKQKSVSLSRLAKQEIVKFIKHEKLQPDEQLPSELVLMEMLGVSRHTVREALVLLEQDKLIYKIYRLLLPSYSISPYLCIIKELRISIY